MKLVNKYGESINHPASLVMSGVESDSYWDLAVSAGFDRLLISFHYIQRKGKKWLKERMEKHPNVKLMIDSGAYTFHTNVEEYKLKPVSYFEDYVRKYTKWLKENKEYIFACVEVDIANIVGFDKVDEFRRDYFEPLKDEGLLVCYVWHEFDGKPHWEEMCQKYDYVGFSLGTGDISEPEAMKMVNIAKRHNAIVHGFAVTRIDLMSRVPFFTGDSTTWLVGTQYGELNWFDGRKMKRLKKKDWKTVYKQKYVKLGGNPKLMEEENPYELIRINALVFKEGEKYIRKRLRGKMYWMNAQQAGGEERVTKKLIRRKKKDAVESETKGELEGSTDMGGSISRVSSTTGNRENSGTANSVEDRPKTKFELFQEQSEEAAPKTHDLAEQIAKLPPMEWFDTDGDDYKDVAASIHMNINGMNQDEVIDILYNYCIFLRQEPDLDETPDDAIVNMAEILLKSSSKTREDALNELIPYYEKNLTGERSDFVLKDAMPPEAPERPKERESYLEDAEYITVDVSDEEMQNLLPAPAEGEEMPEVEELDKELRAQGIVAVRDEQGRFLKGQKKVRKPKQLWSQHFPKLACNTCYKAGECPEYVPDMACAYEKVFKKFNTRNMDDIVDGMTSMADLNMERMQRLMLFETMDGGMADPTLTNMIDQNMRLLGQIKSLHDARNTTIAQQTRVLKEDGTETMTTTVQNPSGGILEKLFGGGSPKRERKDIDEDVIDVEVED